MKATQHYPASFGVAVMELFMEHRKAIAEEVAANQQSLSKKMVKELKDTKGSARGVRYTVAS